MTWPRECPTCNQWAWTRQIIAMDGDALITPPLPLWRKVLLKLLTGEASAPVVYECDWCHHLIPTWWSGSHALVDCDPAMIYMDMMAP
jgi:hypothetical protein